MRQNSVRYGSALPRFFEMDHNIHILFFVIIFVGECHPFGLNLFKDDLIGKHDCTEDR